MSLLGDPRLFLFHCQTCLVGVLMDQLHGLLLVLVHQHAPRPIVGSRIGRTVHAPTGGALQQGTERHQGATW
jgi:hypothetical protein